MIITEEKTFYFDYMPIKLKVVKNTEEIFDPTAKAEDIPLWAELWPSSIGLATFLWGEQSLPGKTVLELGAGIGLPGIVAAKKGALVTQTDYVPEAVQLAMQNARLNGLTNFHAEQADWRNFTIEERFDWIIGSDITYDPQLNPYLKKIFVQNLKPDGYVAIADSGRKAGESFIQELQAEEWNVEAFHLPFIEKDKPCHIWVYKIKSLS